MTHWYELSREAQRAAESFEMYGWEECFCTARGDCITISGPRDEASIKGWEREIAKKWGDAFATRCMGYHLDQAGTRGLLEELADLIGEEVGEGRVGEAIGLADSGVCHVEYSGQEKAIHAWKNLKMHLEEYSGSSKWCRW